ncbi:MAG TPA: type II toxin-antitoxin system VapC family toxin [Thermomicrobiales bacterium]|nr:type II toxin-antitoxin system VapC family toxin [Thermomicrobiales bacterium]
MARRGVAPVQSTMSFLVGTNVIIDGLKGISSATETLASLEDAGLAVSTITLAEVYEGAFAQAAPTPHLASARNFLAGFSVLDVPEPVALRFANLRYTLRRQGNLIPDMDLLIAATALEFKLTLLTRNLRHFERVPDLRLYRS